MKTVFFGPFIGEFGWEVLWWQGWVRKVCLNEFNEYRKIASSFSGRGILYPYVDEFWPHPGHIENLGYSPRNYMADYWIGNKPSGQKCINIRKLLFFREEKWIDVPSSGQVNVGKIFDELLKGYQEKLPNDTLYFVPFRRNFYERDNLEFGVSDLEQGKSLKIPFEHQRIEKIGPDEKASSLFNELLGSYKGKMISVFPRRRIDRRADKNWPKEKYDRLIEAIKDKYPSCKVAILGEPKGAYYGTPEEVPEGVFDLVNFPAKDRLTTQVAVLNNSRFALGGMSGAILFSLMCGCPTLTWGEKTQEKQYYYENFLKTKFYYHPELDCGFPKILELIDRKNF